MSDDKVRIVSGSLVSVEAVGESEYPTVMVRIKQPETDIIAVLNWDDAMSLKDELIGLNASKQAN